MVQNNPGIGAMTWALNDNGMKKVINLENHASFGITEESSRVGSVGLSSNKYVVYIFCLFILAQFCKISVLRLYFNLIVFH